MWRTGHVKMGKVKKTFTKLFLASKFPLSAVCPSSELEGAGAASALFGGKERGGEDQNLIAVT